MIIANAEFIKSSTSFKDCPVEPYPEYAFLGRSNVGKSSLINMLVGRKNLAKTSGTPGKTRLINHFLINSSWYLCDLPGYGFAKVSKSIREKWDKTIKDFMTRRSNLVCSFVLLDIRHEPLKNDLAFLAWIGSNALPLALVFTKADKLSKPRLDKNLSRYRKVLSEQWDPLPLMFVTSSATGQGRDDILKQISLWNADFKADLA